MRTLVTGAAGFIGSHLVEHLLSDGHEVVGLDAFTDYYDPTRKHQNVTNALASPRFRLVDAAIVDAPLEDLLDGVEGVFHLAGQPGVRLSWDEGFRQYVDANIVATQRLLEACRHSSVERLVYASSSSVYGNSGTWPSRESDLPAPHSPYGVTKLAAEHLANLYAANWGLPTVSLRYFTVYGPRQRPDMAIHRLIESARSGQPFPMYGDGSQVRDFTFVGDIVAATVAAMAEADVPLGTVLNVAGGSSTTVKDLIALVASTVGRPIAVDELPASAGDVQRTGGATDRAREILGWQPVTTLPEGVAAQVAWQLGA